MATQGGAFCGFMIGGAVIEGYGEAVLYRGAALLALLGLAVYLVAVARAMRREAAGGGAHAPVKFTQLVQQSPGDETVDGVPPPRGGGELVPL